MKMKRLLLLLTTLALCLSTFSQTSHDKILGKWVSEDKKAVVEFVKNGTHYDAIILKSKHPEHAGKRLITGLTPAGEKAFGNGLLHIIKMGFTINCTAKLIDNNKLELYGKKGIISQTKIWTRL